MEKQNVALTKPILQITIITTSLQVISWVRNKFPTQFLYLEASVCPVGEICSLSYHLMECPSKSLQWFNITEPSRSRCGSRQKCRSVGSSLCPLDTSNHVVCLEGLILQNSMWRARWLWAVQETQSCHKSTSQQHLPKAATLDQHPIV